MAKTLKIKIRDFGSALESLGEVISQKETKVIRGSAIKRFEYCFELAWKTPKDCFRELRRNQMFSDEKTEKLLKMTDDRNRIIHTYDEKFSGRVYCLIKKEYYSLLKEAYDQTGSRKKS